MAGVLLNGLSAVRVRCLGVATRCASASSSWTAQGVSESRHTPATRSTVLRRWQDGTTLQQPQQYRSCSSMAPKKHKRYGMAIRLRPEFQEEYIRYHAAVWPGVLQTIRDCHISNYSIFLRDGTLFGYFEYSGDDLQADMAKMGQCPETQKWWEVMKPMQQPFENLKEDEDWWMMLEEVFHTD